jgi:hypothetical protein
LVTKKSQKALKEVIKRWIKVLQKMSQNCDDDGFLCLLQPKAYSILSTSSANAYNYKLGTLLVPRFKPVIERSNNYTALNRSFTKTHISVRFCQ